MKKLLLLLSVLIWVGIFVLVVPTQALGAGTTFPCCVEGSDPGKKCEKDDDCKGICIGGARDLKDSCSLDKDCKKPCVGGLEPGKDCEVDSDCDGICVGGEKAGDSCEVDSDCEGEPNGTCSLGACSEIGTCEAGTCSGICDEKGPKSPPEPRSASRELLVPLGTVEKNYSSQPCP